MKKSKSSNRNIILKVVTACSLALILGIAVFLRFYQIGKLSFWNDESFSYSAALFSLQNIFRMDPNMSLFHFIAHFWVRILPNVSEEGLRALSAIFSLSSIPVVFLLGKTMDANKNKSTAIGLLAALFVSVNAFHIQYAQEFRGYSLLFLLTALSTFFLIKAVEQTKNSSNFQNYWWVWYVLVSAGALYSHFFALFVLLAQAVSMYIFYLIRGRVFPLYEFVVSGFATMVLIIPVAKAAFARGAGQIGWISEPTVDSLREFAIEISGKQGMLLFILYLLAVSIGLIGAGTLFKKDLITQWKFALFGSCLFLPIVMSLIISKLITPIFQEQYLLFVMPYLAVLASVGIVSVATLGGKNWKRAVIFVPIGAVTAIFIVALSAVGVGSYFEKFQKEDWRAVAQFVTANCSDKSNLRLYYAPFVERDATYYNPNLSSQIRNWNDVLKNPSLENISNALTNKYKQACLILSHVDPRDNPVRKNIQNALKLKFPNVNRTQFYRVDVEIYRQR